MLFRCRFFLLLVVGGSRCKESMSDIQSINKLYFKCLKNIGANVFAEQGVVPEYVVPLSVFSFVSCRWFVM